MGEKILFVDDDPNILAAYRRSLRKAFDLETALSGYEGLKAIDQSGPFAVIVSDMRMPGMDGVQFLAKAETLAPDSVRMMLTGNADQKTATDAVNTGHIFRFISKPCSPDFFAAALDSGIRQYRLITAEKELLEKTLKGSIKVLAGVLAMASPIAFGRASRVTRLAVRMANQMQLEDAWQLEVATMLSQIGCVTLPEETLAKVYQGAPLTAGETLMFEAHPKSGSELIANIPRLELVAEIIASQNRRFDGSGQVGDFLRGEDIPFGARVLKLLLDYDSLTVGGADPARALDELKGRKGFYDPSLIDVLHTLIHGQPHHISRAVKLNELTPNMILDQDLMTVSGMLIVAKGQEVTRSLCARLKNFAHLGDGISEPIRIIIPESTQTQDHEAPKEKAA